MAEDNLQPQPKPEVVYDESKIRHLEDTEHIRTRPGMYIGRLGDGSHAEDGIYVLLKESIDNSIDEFNEGYGKRIEVNIHDNLSAEIRDYGRGIPLGALVDAVSKLNTGGKYDTAVFTASVGMNGVGLKAVNALSVRFAARSVRDGKMREATFEKGVLISDTESTTDEENGTYIFFQPDKQLFVNYRFHSEFVENLLRNYTYLNTGLAIFYNGRRIISRNGLEDLLNDNMTAPVYPIIHLTGPTSTLPLPTPRSMARSITPLSTASTPPRAVRTKVPSKSTLPAPSRSISARTTMYRTCATDSSQPLPYASSNRSSRAKPKSNWARSPWRPTRTQTGKPFPLSGISVNKFVGDFVKENVDNYLHMHTDIADVLKKKIEESEKERKAIAGVTKLARERAKKANLHNRKLRDCRIHLNDPAPKSKKRTRNPMPTHASTLPFSSPRATLPAVPSPRAAMSTPRRYFRYAANRSTALA